MYIRYTFFCQITTFIKVDVTFVFGLQTLGLIDFTRILMGLKPKVKGQRNFYECCDLTKKVYLMYTPTEWCVFLGHTHTMRSKDGKIVQFKNNDCNTLRQTVLRFPWIAHIFQFLVYCDTKGFQGHRGMR